jgi:hypothetical protein
MSRLGACLHFNGVTNDYIRSLLKGNAMSPLLVYISRLLGIGEVNISLLSMPVDDLTELINQRDI